jgi:hypothetical protein
VRSEIVKLFDDISQRIRRCEERLSVLEPVYSSVDLVRLEERHGAAFAGCRFCDCDKFAIC